VSRCVWWRGHGATGGSRPEGNAPNASEGREVAGQGKADRIRRAPIGDQPRVNKERNAPLLPSTRSRGRDVAQPRRAAAATAAVRATAGASRRRKRRCTWRGSGVVTVTVPLKLRMRARLRKCASLQGTGGGWERMRRFTGQVRTKRVTGATQRVEQRNLSVCPSNSLARCFVDAGCVAWDWPVTKDALSVRRGGASMGILVSLSSNDAQVHTHPHPHIHTGTRRLHDAVCECSFPTITAMAGLDAAVSYRLVLRDAGARFLLHPLPCVFL
jgi:hypothetical protein